MMLSLDEFVAVVSDRLGVSARPDDLLIGDLELDSLGIYEVLVVAEEFVPGFRLPEQFELEDVRLADVFHYLDRPQAWQT